MRVYIFCLVYLALLGDAVAKSPETSSFLYRNQKISSINWHDISERSWLSLKGWKRDLQWREKIGNWKLYFQEVKLVEPVGHLLQCVGTCKVFRGVRGETFFPVTRSKLYERDEFQTLDNSYAYIYLLNGTIIRLSPNSSVSINEFNLTPHGSFTYIRLNWGQVRSIPRVSNKFIVQDMRETDIIFYPLDFYQAHIDIQERGQFDDDHLFKYTKLKKDYKKTYLYLNKLLEKNLHAQHNFVTKILWGTNNCLVSSTNQIIDLIHLENSNTFIRSQTGKDLYYTSEPQSENTAVVVRGKRNVSFDTLDNQQWYIVKREAKEVDIYPEGDKRFYIPSLLTRRIPTIFIAREKFLRKFSPFLLETELNKRKMATKYSFRLWDTWDSAGDIDLRYQFLIKFLHRVERKNFLEQSKFSKILDKRGEHLVTGVYDESFYSKALKLYLFSQKRHFEILDQKTGLLNSTKRKFWKIITKQYD